MVRHAQAKRTCRLHRTGEIGALPAKVMDMHIAPEEGVVGEEGWVDPKLDIIVKLIASHEFVNGLLSVLRSRGAPAALCAVEQQHIDRGVAVTVRQEHFGVVLIGLLHHRIHVLLRHRRRATPVLPNPRTASRDMAL